MASMPANDLMMDDEDEELEDSQEGEEQDDGKEEEYDRRMFGISQALPVPDGPLPELGDDGTLGAVGTAAGMQRSAQVCSQGRACAALLAGRASGQQVQYTQRESDCHGTHAGRCHAWLQALGSIGLD